MKLGLSVLGLCLAVLLTACGGGDPAESSKIKTLVAYVSTYSGGSRATTVIDGPASVAGFSRPYGLTVKNGDVYVADAGTIRKITPAGDVTTIATIQGSSPTGIAMDGFGFVYASSQFENRIYKIDTKDNNKVTIFAGDPAGYSGFSNSSSGTSARFFFPLGLAVDADNNVYVADSGNHAIRKITTAGAVSTVAGTGLPGSINGLGCPSGCPASFSTPSGLSVDSSGNIFVADYGSAMIRKIAPTGVVTTLAGKGTEGDSDGTGVAAEFKSPTGVAVDNQGNVYVADSGNNMIRRVTSGGVVTTLAGGRSGLKNGYGYSALFAAPTDIAIDSSGVFYVADSGNSQIRKLTLSMQ